MLGRADISKDFVTGHRNLVVDERAATATVKLPELDLIVDVQFGITDQRIGEFERIRLAHALVFVIVIKRAQLGFTFVAGPIATTAVFANIERG